MKHLIAIIAISLFTGCQSVYYHNRFPILERPVRPTLENVSAEEFGKLSEPARQAVSGNFNKLIDYSRKLEISVDEYNKYATEQNKGTNK